MDPITIVIAFIFLFTLRASYFLSSFYKMKTLNFHFQNILQKWRDEPQKQEDEIQNIQIPIINFRSFIYVRLTGILEPFFMYKL